MGKKYSVFLCVLFCGVLLAFFAAQLIVPDKEFSPNENRYLQQKPELTAESFQLRFPLEESGDFFTGKFMSTFETYVTDQFPGRDGWISTKSLSEKIMGKRENNGVYFGTDNQTLISRFDEPDPDRVVRNLDYVNKLVEKVDIPVLGVIPMADVDIEDEDSLADRLNQREKGDGTDIVVVRLPHLSNFTDFDVLERLEGVSVRYVETPGEVGLPDVLIIPGTKNTMSDLKWMRENGLAAKIQELSAVDIPVVGICGGFQMLGKRLSDPYGVENKGTMDGLGLLDAKTVFSREKVRHQAKGKMTAEVPGWEMLNGMETEGYEIHMGVTRNLGDCREIMYKQEEGRPVLGLGNKTGTVIGTYLHGFFDAPGMAERFVVQVEARKRAETEPAGQIQPSHDWKAYKETQYDKLAALVRESLDMEQVYRILNEGVGKDVQ